MIIAKKAVRDYIKAQPTIEGFADDISVSRQTIHNILNGDPVSSELVTKIILKTGFEFEKAFEVKE